MQNWMKSLASHYERMRQKYANENLLIVFDIDGTIVDMRYMIAYVLNAYDEFHGSKFFKNLKVTDINSHENEVEEWLRARNLLDKDLRKILTWYQKFRWTPKAIDESHRYFAGGMEVIRWFQLQQRTFVGLNSGRPEALRADTLRSLNQLGKLYKVRFENDLLFLNPFEGEKQVKRSKLHGLLHFKGMGFRIFAFIDNEPDNLNAVSRIDKDKEIILLHADTLFQSKRRKLPYRSISGKEYDITALIEERDLPRHVQFVWHGVNDEKNLRQFLSSDVQWAEFDVRQDPIGDNLILRHDSFQETPIQPNEEFMKLDFILSLLKKAGKSIKLDIKQNGFTVDKVLELIASLELSDDHLWFNASLATLNKVEFRLLYLTHPRAIIQCPIDDIVPIIYHSPSEGHQILKSFRSWGINRFSISWTTAELRNVMDQLDYWGYDINIYNVPDLESFLKAVLLLPASITSDFNFPQWSYFGRGSGAKMRYHEYLVKSALALDSTRWDYSTI